MLGDTSMAYSRCDRDGAGRLTHGTPFIMISILFYFGENISLLNFAKFLIIHVTT